MKKLFLVQTLIIISLFVNAQIDSIIYGFTSVPSGSFFSKIDPQTGMVIYVSNLIPYPYGYGGRTIDPRTGTMYFLQNSNLVKNNLYTGQNVGIINVINYPNMEFTGIVYNCFDTLLYGLSYDAINHSVYLATVHKNTGMVSNLSDSVASSYMQLTSTAIDPYSNIFYFETINNQLVGIGLYTGEVFTNVQISCPDTLFFGPISFNCADTILYGLYGNMNMGRRLAKIDPLTGFITTISSDNVAQGLYNYPSTLDPFKSIYYFVSSDGNLRGVDLLSGALILNVPIIAPDSFGYFTNPIFNHECYYDYTVNVEKKGLEQLSIFPNPANNNINIISKGFANITLVDYQGRMLLRKNVHGSIEIDTKDIVNGIYLVTVQSQDHIYKQKIVINHNTN